MDASAIHFRAADGDFDLGFLWDRPGEADDEDSETEVDTLAFLGDGCDMSESVQNADTYGENRTFQTLLSLSHVSILVLVPP
ncbi:hypothetical protein N9N28_00845 [Rubripirellula amarantea]|nr:hypothetical protein [Rubripirellula amarantea]